MLRREAETDRQRRDDSYRQDLDRRELESKKQLEKVIGDMEKKREQVMIGAADRLSRFVSLEETIIGRFELFVGFSAVFTQILWRIYEP